MLPLFAAACNKKPDAFTGYGKNKTIVRKLDHFTKLQVGQKFRIFITTDSSLPEQIEITYSENLVEDIGADIQEGLLKIRDHNHYNWVRKLDVQPRCTLNIRTLSELNIDGAAEVTCLDSISSPALNVALNSVGHQKLMLYVGILSGGADNPGNIEFSGRSNIFTFSCENGSWFDARNLDADDAYVFHYTDRDVYISPRNILEANVWANGNVYYNKDPGFRFTKNEHGKGRVIRQ